jgi:hypothetical protein
MLKWCLSTVAVLGLCAFLGAQVPGGGQTSVRCGESGTMPHPAASVTSYGETSQSACGSAWFSIQHSLQSLAGSKCAGCLSHPTLCYPVLTSTTGTWSSDSHYDPILMLWVCTVTVSPGTMSFFCQICD